MKIIKISLFCLPEIIVQWKVALIPLKNHCIGNGYLKLGQGKTRKDTRFIVNLASRLSLKTKNAFLIDKDKNITTGLDSSQMCFYKQVKLLRFIFKKKHFPCFFYLKDLAAKGKNVFLFVFVLEVGTRKEGT